MSAGIKASADGTQAIIQVAGVDRATLDNTGKFTVTSIVAKGAVAQLVTTALATVATGTTVLPIDNTIPQNTEGDQYLSVTITPTSASSTLEIDIELVISHSVSGVYMAAALFQDSTANALAATADANSGGAGGFSGPLKLKHIMPAGTTSATTFKVRAGSSTAGTTSVNGASGVQVFGGVASSRITVKEYLP